MDVFHRSIQGIAPTKDAATAESSARIRIHVPGQFTRRWPKLLLAGHASDQVVF